MAKIHFPENGKVIEVETGILLVEGIRKAGFSLETPCRGMGLCGKCSVKATGELSPMTEEEERFLRGSDPSVRLACLTRIEGDTEVAFLSEKGLFQSIPAEEIDSTGAFCLDREDRGEKLGICIDIGTTGITALLLDEVTGSVLGKKSILNPQTEYGADVLTRIHFTMEDPNGLEVLRRVLVEGLKDIFSHWKECGHEMSKVDRIIVAANTTMLHLLAGISPITMAKAPYKAAFLESRELDVQELGWDLLPKAKVILLPSASSYVGADIVAGIFALDLQKKKDPVLFIDLGTNGEIALIKDGQIFATSTAAGPALEGMNISCGCRAEQGAIERVRWTEEKGWELETIGGEKPKGICGSGLIDLIAELVRHEIIKPNGRLGQGTNETLNCKLGEKSFLITEELKLLQKDIRQVQLAKGAIAAGVSMLLAEVGMDIENVSELIVAGAFGFHVDGENLKRIGLVPKGFSGEILFAGNTSLEGAKLALLQESAVREMSELCQGISVIELSGKADFQEHFIRELSF